MMPANATFMTQMRKITILLLAFGQVFSLYSQTQFFVSPSGSDNNSGTSPGNAWQSVQHACDNATPGSTVNIMAGTYHEKVEVNVSGTAGNSITYRNNDSDVVILDGTGIATPDAILGIFNQSYLIIQGLTIKNNEQNDAQGILVEGVCQNIELRNNDISHINFSTNPNAGVNAGTNSQPIIVFGTDGTSAISGLIIDGNIVHDSRTGFSEGLAVNGNVDGFGVTNNTVRDITNIGIDCIGHEGTAPANDQARNGLVKGNTVFNCKSPIASAGGIYVDGGRDIVVENNTVYRCQWGIEVGCENVGKSASGVKVRNNFIYNNDDACIAFGGFDFPGNSGKVTTSFISNNTCFGNDVNEGGVGGITAELNISYTENCSLENNIFYSTNASNLLLFVDGVGSLDLNLNYNQFFTSGNTATVEFDYEGATHVGFSSYKNGAGQDSNSLFGDPELANILMPDLHLTASSPALDAGNPSFVPAPGEQDIDGESRVQNSRVDIGADEFSELVAVTNLDNEKASVKISPNPFHETAVIETSGLNSQVVLLEIFNLEGALVRRLPKTSPGKLEIRREGLAAGIFWLKITTATGSVFTTKIILL